MHQPPRPIAGNPPESYALECGYAVFYRNVYAAERQAWQATGNGPPGRRLAESGFDVVPGSGEVSPLTQLGRHRAGSAYEKHHIKAADRLSANRHLHAERDGIYCAIARTLLTGIKHPVVIVDWSDMEPRRRWLVIKAAAAVDGETSPNPATRGSTILARPARPTRWL